MGGSRNSRRGTKKGNSTGGKNKSNSRNLRIKGGGTSKENKNTPPKNNKNGNSKQAICADIRKDKKERCQSKEIEENIKLQSRILNTEESYLFQCVQQQKFQDALNYLQDDGRNLIDTETKKVAAVHYTHKGTTVLHEAIRLDAPYELLELLVFIGGKEAVTTKDRGNGYSTLILACKIGSSSEVVDVLCFMGGKEAVHQTDNFNELAIHKWCFRQGPSTAVGRKLMDTGDSSKMLKHKNKDGMIPLHCSVYFFNTKLEVCEMLIKEGMHNGVCGGGLFSSYKDLRGERKTVFDKLHKNQLFDCLLKNIVNKVSEKHGNFVDIGAKHGMKWKEGMETLVEAIDEDSIKLGVVALAASGEESDLTTIYELTKRYAGQLFH